MNSWISVPADHHQFSLSLATVDMTEPLWESSLVDLGPGFVTFHTGIANGPVNVAVEFVPEDPGGNFDEWEVVTEVDFEMTGPLYLTSPAEVSISAEPLLDAQGEFRFRMHARGRDLQWDHDVTRASEDYLIQLWRSERPSGNVQRKKSDLAWASTPIPTRRSLPGAEMPRPDASPRRDVQALGGRRNGQLVNRVRYSPAQVRGMADSHQLASLDQDAVNSIFTLNAQQLRQVTVWSALHAVREAGIADVGWISEGIADLVANNSIPDAFRSRAEYLSYSDDQSIPSTPTKSIFDERMLTREHMAVLSIVSAFGSDPLLAVIQSLKTTAQVYGPRVEQLMVDLDSFLATLETRE